MFRWFLNMRVRSKLFVISLISVIFLFVLAYSGLVTMRRMAEHAERMYAENVSTMNVLSELSNLAWHVRAEMLVSLLTDDAAGRTQLQEKAAGLEQQLRALVETLGHESLTAEEQQALQAFNDAWEQYSSIRETLRMASTVDTVLAREMAFSGQDAQLHQAAMDALSALRTAKAEVAGRLKDEIRSELANQIIILIVVMAGSVIVTLLANVVIGRLITRAVAATADLVNRVAQGDLRAVGKVFNYRDELGKMGQAVNQMLHNLREVIQQVSVASEELMTSSTQLTATAQEATRATQQIAATMEQVAAGTTDQSRAVQEAATVMGELNHIIEGIARGAEQQTKAVQKASEVMARMVSEIEATAKTAQEVAQSAVRAMETARSGEGAVRETVAGMHDIHQTVHQTAEKVKELGSHSYKVGEIVQVISEIADQTNLLALNAAIEAARAGEHGKGFAVVADEVRKLAERSAASAKEITQLIESMRQGIGQAVSAMQEGTDRVQRGRELAERAGAAIDDILKALSETNAQVQHISEAARRNTEAVHEMTRLFQDVASISDQNMRATETMAKQSERVNAAIENISAVSEETAASAEEVSASTQEMTASFEQVSSALQRLAAMAKHLQELVARFKL